VVSHQRTQISSFKKFSSKMINLNTTPRRLRLSAHRRHSLKIKLHSFISKK